MDNFKDKNSTNIIWIIHEFSKIIEHNKNIIPQIFVFLPNILSNYISNSHIIPGDGFPKGIHVYFLKFSPFFSRCYFIRPWTSLMSGIVAGISQKD
jgi:hypothetical protein